MTFVSVAQAAHCLGIDAKTLHHWLAEAQFPLRRHPGDGRKKGLSEEHLQALARLHQRRLAPLSPQPPAPGADQEPQGPGALLGLAERLDALQLQLTALQQQVTDLTRLLPSHVPEPGSPTSPAKPRRRTKRLPTPTPAPSAPRSRPATKPPAKSPRKPAQVIARVEYSSEGRYVVICPKQGVLPFEPESPAWFVWLATQSSFRFVGKMGTFSAHHEARVPKGAWRAHRKIRTRGHSLRLALTQGLTIAVLEQAAATLQAHLK